MSDVHELMGKFIEDRDSLSEEELERLVSQLRARPLLTAEFKDQLTVDDLLAQKFDLTRWHFLPQIDQRLREESREFPGLLPSAFDLASTANYRGESSEFHSQFDSNMPSPAAEPFPVEEPTSRRKTSSHWPLTIVTLLLATTIGVLVAAMIVRGRTNVIARLEGIEGEIHLIHHDIDAPANSGTAIRAGDRLVSASKSRATVRYPDGTTVQVDAGTSVTFSPIAVGANQKKLLLDRGRLSADVAPQPLGRPMIFASPNAQAEVLGTKLTLFVEDHQTHLKVTEGRVRLTRDSDRKSVLVAKNEIGVSGPQTLATAPVLWPSNRDGLLFLFETNDSPNQVRSLTSGMNRSYTVRPRGRAHLNHDGAMVLTGGAFLANDVDGEILAACRQTNQLSVEATVVPASNEQTGPARIVTFSTDINQRDFTLGQQGNQLIVRIRTPMTGQNGVGSTENGVPVATLVAGQAHHVIVSYQPGRLVCYLNGKQVFEGDTIQGDFRDWSAQHLLFGDEYGGQRDWSGRLEGIAIYNRLIGPQEAARNALQYDDRRQSRPRVPQTRIRARLIEKSAIPTVESILPHRSALVVYKYRVEQVLGGKSIGKEVCVAHWAVLDGTRQPIVELAPESVQELLLEPYDQNPQVDHYFCSDDFSTASAANSQRFLEVQE